jgi:hypothetical protein
MSSPRATRPPTVVPTAIVERVRAICLAQPEVQEQHAWVGTRWVVRKRNFAHVVRIEDGRPPAYAKAAGSDGPITILTFRAPSDLADTLRTAGPPFFFCDWGTQWGTKVIGMTLDGRTSWKEVATLLGESYRALAPKKLLTPPANRRSRAR